MFDPSLEVLLLLCVVAFLAGFIDSMAGGGGLLVIPSLLLAGFDPVVALGTNKLQGLFGTGSSAITYATKGLVDIRAQRGASALAFFSALLGALIAAIVPATLLAEILPFLLIAIALYFAFAPGIGGLDRARRIGPLAFMLLIVPTIGFYDGLFGPGTGSFFMLALVSLCGFGLLKATAHTKVLNFSSNVGGFVGFVMIGAVAWKIGLFMGAAQILGARLGATMAVRNGSRLIRPLLVVMCLILAAKLLLA